MTFHVQILKKLCLGDGKHRIMEVILSGELLERGVPTIAPHGINIVGNLPGFTTTWTRNPPEEGDSAANNQLIDEESAR
jgi:hypothetical protein